MDVSVIIVNYNTFDLIVECIKSIYEKTIGVEFEIIVVDNSSTDKRIHQLNDTFPNIVLIALEANIGFGRANNEGIKVAIGRNILFLNSDTKLINNAIKILSNYLDSKKNVGACGGNLFNEDMMPTHSYRLLFPSIACELNDLLFRLPETLLYGKSPQHNFTNKSKNVAYITGADLMIKKSIIDEIGCFSPMFFMYYEEADLCYRIIKAGLEVISVPEAKIQHLEGKSFGNKKVNQNRINLSEKSRIIFYSKNYSKTYCIIANNIYLTNIILRIFVLNILRKDSDNYWKSILKGHKSAKL